MKKHLLALLSVGSLVTLLPGCGSCCDKKEEVVAVEETTTPNSEVAAVETEVAGAVETPADVSAETVPTEDKH